MASTYSTNLKIEIMATGENSGTWGTITNTNLGTALEQAIVGYGNPSFASDANLTLTYTDTNAAQAARALVLNVTSAVSLTGTRELVVPTIQKQYIVQNNTTGSQSITVKTSGGTGITVPNGRKAHLYVDGTNVIQMFDFVDINGGAIDGTTVGASSASTGAFTTLTASGATTLNGAVALGDAAADLITVPGTVNSNVIFTDNTFDIGASGATRPRTGYFGTSVLSPLVTATNLQVTNIKANDGTAVAVLTDSTGATDFSKAFTLSATTQNISLGASQTTGTFVLGGTAATGAITLDASTKTHTLGVGSGATESGATKTINIGTGGVSGSTTTIGIGSINGTTTTLYGTVQTAGFNAITIDTTNLEVTNIKAKDGTSAIVLTDSTGAVTISTALTANGGAVFNENGANVDFRVEGDTDANLIFADASADYVGIGTNAPGARLELRGPDNTAINSKGNLFVSDGGTATQSAGEGGQISLGAWLNGDLTNPYAMGVIKGITESSTTNVNGGALLFGTAQSSTVVVERARITSTGTLNIVGAGTAGSTQAISFNGSAPVDSLVVTSAGDVGIGTNAPGAKLDVRGTVNAQADTAYYRIRRASAADVGYITDSTTWGDSGTDFTIGASSSNLRFYTNNNTTERMRLDSSGNLGIGTSSPLAKLHVAGEAIFVSGVTTQPAITITQGFINGDISSANFTIGNFGDNSSEMRVATRGFTTFFTGATNNNTGTERMRLDSSGNLGLGVTPATVYGESSKFTIDATGKTNGIYINFNGTGADKQIFLTNGGFANCFVGTDNTAMTFGTGNTERARITSTGEFQWKPNGSTQAMTLDASGRLLVGTTSAFLSTFKSVVEGATSGSANFALGLFKSGTPQILNGDVLGNIYFYGADNDVTAGNNNLGAQISCVATTDWTTDGTTSNAALVFYTHGTASGAPPERARITSGGDFRVKGAGTAGSTEAFQVSGSAPADAARLDSNGYFDVDCTATPDGTTRRGFQVVANTGVNDTTKILIATTTTSTRALAEFNNGNGNVGSISVTGSATAYNTSSDYRLKDNPQPLTNSGAFIDALKPKTWNWKADGSKGVGFIAHEVQEVSPGSVVGGKDGEQMQAMEYGSAEFIANIVAELQSLRARVAQLEQGV